jgi:hypothetical protein
MLARALSRCIQSTDTLPLMTVTSSWAITTYTFRAMSEDNIEVMRQLGFER